MSVKIKKEWLAGVVAALLIGGQAYYFYTIHPVKKAELEMTQSEVAIKSKQLETLERQYVQLEATKEELEVTKLQVAAIKDKLPSYVAASKNMVEMMIMMENGSFSDLQVQVGAEETQVLSDQEIMKLGYQMTFVAPFNEVRQIIENLKSSYQILQLHNLNISNAPQNSPELYENKHGHQMHQLVEAQVDFSVFARTDVAEDLYEATGSTLTNPENAFLSREVPDEKKQETVTDSSKPDGEGSSTVTPEETREDEPFQLSIYDILVSGDTHRFVGPKGQDEELYAGAVTDQDITVILDI